MNQQEVAALKARLRKDHEAQLKEYEAEIAAIERVERLLLGAAPAPSGSPEAPRADGPQDAPTIIATVEQWFQWFPDQTFTVDQLFKKMSDDQHFRFESVNPVKSVHTAVWRLKKDGIIRTVLRGKGRRRSTYQLVEGARHPTEQNDQTSLNGRV